MKWTVKGKLQAAFGSLLLLMVLLSGISWTRLETAQVLEERQLNYAAAAHSAQTLQSTLLQSRRHEKDFFARFGDVKYIKAQKERQTQFAAEANKIRARLAKEDSDLLKKLQVLEMHYVDYHTAFDESARLFQERGNHDTGLQGEFRTAAHDVEEAANQAHDLVLENLLLQARRAEKDYLLREDLKYRDRLNDLADDLAEHLKSVENGRSILPFVESYRRKFNAAVEKMLELNESTLALHEVTTKIETEVEQFQTDANTALDEIQAQGQASRQEARSLMIAIFAFALVLGVLVTRIISNQLTAAVITLMEGTLRIGRGDLTTRVNLKSNDELGDLATAFNKMTDNLSVMSRDVIAATNSIYGVVNELRATVAEQGAALQQQAASVSETVATVDEMSRSSAQVSETANQVLDSASRAAETSRQGRAAIDMSVKGMHDVREQVQNIATTILELSDKTQQIGTIIATVDDFAEQSSLLALNASIEAARAGEEGKAFGVVAGEVKNLAEQSQRATEKVRGILNDIQRATHTAVMVTEEGSKRVDRGVDLVSSAGEIIQALARSIEESGESAKQIASASRQQTNGVEQITVAVSGIDQFSRQNLEAIRQTEETAEALVRVAEELKSTAAQYQA
jgi:methyl-accepting chemotaxis protein